jgi:hypothetical protein
MRAMITFIAGVLLVVLSALQPGHAEEGAAAPVDYLIVCADGLAEAAAEWAAYRESHGRQAKVVTLAEIGGETTPGLDAIRARISAEAGEPVREGFQVLLMGAVPREGSESYNPAAEIPWFLTDMLDGDPDVSISRKRIPTDNFFADLTGDGLPDVAIGRIPARTAEQARAALAKVKAYEASPPDVWMRRLTFFAGEGRFGPQVDGMLERLFVQFAEQILPPAYDLRMTYANLASSYAWVPREFSAKVIEEANAGALLLVYLGHGAYDRLDDMQVRNGERLHRFPILTGDDVGKFAIKDGRLPVMLIVACATGYLDHPRGCLAERIVFQPDAPVAVVASSRDSHPWSNTLLQLSFIGETVDKRRATLGEAFRLAKRELVLGQDPRRAQLEALASLVMPDAEKRAELNRAHVAHYNLIGDPGLRLRHPEIPLGGEGIQLGARPEEKQLVPLRLGGRGPGGLRWSGTIEVARGAIAGELPELHVPDLFSDDAEKRTAAEYAIRGRHAVSNNKVATTVRVSPQGLAEEGEWPQTWFVLVEPEKAVPPGAYVLKLFALDEKGGACGFTALKLEVKK